MCHMTTAMDYRRRPEDTLPLRLVMLRHECGHLSQRQAAFRCGITPRVWQGMEDGRSTAKLLDILKRIADEFGYDRDWLAYGGPLEDRSTRPDGGDSAESGAAAKPESPLSGSNGRPLAYLVPRRPVRPVLVPVPGETAA